MILAALTFTIASSTFKANATMPMRTVYTRCGGENASPELHWQGAPKGTRSFALIAHDPDAPAPGGWYHWVVYNLPAATRELPQRASISQNRLGETSFQEARYGGPCPPPGKPHHYHFTLYALDDTIAGARLTGPQLEAAMKNHVLASTTVIGLFGR